MNIIEHTIIIQHTCPAVHVRRILHCLGVGQLMIIQQVGSAVSALNKTKNACSCKSVHSSAHRLDSFMSSFPSLTVVWEGDPPQPPSVSHS